MYLEIDEGFDAHPKTVRLCRVMGDVNAGQYLIRIWAWATRSAPDGDISGMEAGDVESIARYAPMDGKLFDALTCVWSEKFGPWIDGEGGSLRLHGWDERQGAAIKRLERHAAKMREAREKKNRERDGHVPVTCPSREAHVKARPDQTRPDQSGSDPCPPGGPGEPLVLSVVADRPARQANADAILAVFAHYRAKHPKAFANPQSGSKEWRLVRDRLRGGYTVESLCKAIDGYHLSPHHQGQNDRGTKYLDLELFMRDDSHVNAGIRFAEFPPKQPAKKQEPQPKVWAELKPDAV